MPEGSTSHIQVSLNYITIPKACRFYTIHPPCFLIAFHLAIFFKFLLTSFPPPNLIFIIIPRHDMSVGNLEKDVYMITATISIL